jgi:hypothetical protein
MLQVLDNAGPEGDNKFCSIAGGLDCQRGSNTVGMQCNWRRLGPLRHAIFHI